MERKGRKLHRGEEKAALRRGGRSRGLPVEGRAVCGGQVRSGSGPEAAASPSRTGWGRRPGPALAPPVAGERRAGRG